MASPLLVRGQTFVKRWRGSLQIGAGVAALLIALGGAVSSNASEPWEWRDLSQNIPSSVQTGLTLTAGRGTDWLASDGERLWSVNTREEVTNYTDRAQARGRVQKIASDGSKYLLGFQGLNGPTLTQTDLQTWTDATDLRFPQKRLRGLAGSGGRWAIITEDQFEDGVFPRSWQINLWDASGTAFPQTLNLPTDVSSFVPGCFKERSSSTICAGQSMFLPINGTWYLFAGSAETRDGSGQAAQTARAGVWRWNVDRFEAVANAPKARFISGVWGAANSVLLATTDAVTNPYAADTYWTFDGGSFKSFKNEPLEAGMLSVDTRSIQAAWTGKAWAILAGKNLIQMRNGAFAVEGMVRDTPASIAGSTAGQALVVGQRGTFDATSTEITKAPFLAMIGEKLSTNDAAYLIRPAVNMTARTQLTRVIVSGDTEPAFIHSGESFAFRAEASGDNGVRSLDMLVNGVRVATCETTSCRYTQTYWNTDDTDPRERRVVLSARATDQTGRVTESTGLILLVRKMGADGIFPTPVSSVDEGGRMPAGLSWKTDSGNGIGIASWITPSTTATTITNNETRTLRVAATHTSGIDRIEMWVNGRATKTCTNDQEGGIWFCNASLGGSDYSYGSQIFVNARVVSKEGKESWSPSYRFDR